MSGRGRGGRGGRGATKSFSREQLTSMGVGGNDLVPGPVSQPPPLYPPLNRKPVPMTPSVELEYLLILRQDIIDHMQLSTSYLKLPGRKANKSEQKIDKLIAQLPSAREKFDWELFPAELRPKVIVKRTKKQVPKDVDVEKRLTHLEKLEEKRNDVTVKEEVEDEEAEEEIEMQDEIDEEMDEGTDYANNYFDNGEGYDDEDDNLDDGPVY